MVQSSVDGPDFICVGLPKSGSGWLADQLKYHPDFWMPPVKEFAYLRRDPPTLTSTKQEFELLKRHPPRPLRSGWSNRREGDVRDYKFLEEACGAIGKPMDINFYAQLFRYKEGTLSGDVSTAYCALNKSVIDRLAERLPSVKMMLLVRDPIDRAWSHVSMWHRASRGKALGMAKKFEKKLLDRPRAFRAMLEGSASFMRTSFPAKVAKAWHRDAPQLSFRSFLFDDMRDTPEKVRAEILHYLGADPAKPSGALVAGHNKKANSEKLPLSDDIRAELVTIFAQEIRDCANLFGGRATEWPSRYGL